MWQLTAAVWMIWSFAPGWMENIPTGSGPLASTDNPNLDHMDSTYASTSCSYPCNWKKINLANVHDSPTWNMQYYCDCSVPTRTTTTSPRPTSEIVELLNTPSAEPPAEELSTTTTTTPGTTTTEPTTPCPTTPYPDETLPWQKVMGIVEYLAYLDVGTSISSGSAAQEHAGRTDKAFCYFCQTSWTLLEYQGFAQSSVDGLFENGSFYGKYPGDNQIEECNKTDLCKNYPIDAWKTACLPTTTTTTTTTPTTTTTSKPTTKTSSSTRTTTENKKTKTTTTKTTTTPKPTWPPTTSTWKTSPSTTTTTRRATTTTEKERTTTTTPKLTTPPTTSSSKTSPSTSATTTTKRTTTTRDSVSAATKTTTSTQRTTTAPSSSSGTTTTAPSTSTTEAQSTMEKSTDSSTTATSTPLPPITSTTSMTIGTRTTRPSMTSSVAEENSSEAEIGTPTPSTTSTRTHDATIPYESTVEISTSTPNSLSSSSSAVPETRTSIEKSRSEAASESSFTTSFETTSTPLASSTKIGTSTMESIKTTTSTRTTEAIETKTTGMVSTEAENYRELTASGSTRISSSTMSASSSPVASPQSPSASSVSSAETSSTVLSTTTARLTTSAPEPTEMFSTKEVVSTAFTSSQSPTSSSSSTTSTKSSSTAFSPRSESSPVDTSPTAASILEKSTAADAQPAGKSSVTASTEDETSTAGTTSTAQTSPTSSSSSKKTTSETKRASSTSARPSPPTSGTSSSLPSSTSTLPRSSPPPTAGKTSSTSTTTSTVSSSSGSSSSSKVTSNPRQSTAAVDSDDRAVTSPGEPRESVVPSRSSESTTKSISPSASPAPKSSSSSRPSSSPSSTSKIPEASTTSRRPSSSPSPSSSTPDKTTSSASTGSSTSSTAYRSPSSTTVSHSSPSSRRPGTTTVVSKTPPQEWRDCEKVCPPGYEEGENYCYHLIPHYHAGMYTYAVSYCNRNFSVDLADETDFASSENLALFRMMNTSAQLFWINAHRSKTLLKTYKAALVNVTNSTAFRLAVNSVRVGSRYNMTNGVCRAPKFCAPMKCKISDIYSVIGYLMPPVPAQLPSEFDAGMTFNEACLPPATNNATTTCSHFGQWEPHQSRLECVNPDAAPPPKPEKITSTNKAVRKSCDECHSIGTDNCTEVDGGYKCNCKEGWTKFTCWLSPDVCTKKSCSGNGKCHQFSDSFTCECDAYHAGPRCKTKLLETTWFGENDTVAIINAGTVTAGIYTGNNMLILGLKAATKVVTLKDGVDPMEQFQQMRAFVLAVAGMAVAMFAKPSFLLLTPFFSKMAFFLEQALFGLAFVYYLSEARQVYWTISGFNRNEWNVDSTGKQRWYLHFLLRNHLPLIVTYGVASVIAQLSWNSVANNLTTMGLFDDRNFLPMLILVIFHFGFAFSCAATGYDSYYIYKNRPEFYLQICYEAELGKKTKLEDTVRKVARNILFIIINPPLLAFSWLILSMSYFYDNIYLDWASIVLGGVYSAFSATQSLITHSGNYETLLKNVFRFLPDWNWLPRITPISRLTREEVRCAYRDKSLESIKHPFKPSFDYWYLNDEERYWLHRTLTQEYCNLRFETGNKPEECAHAVTINALGRAFDCDDEQMIYWIAVWFMQIEEHDTFDIKMARQTVISAKDQLFRRMTAPLMTKGMIEEEQRKVKRYKDLADLLKRAPVDQTLIRIPLNRLPLASWTEWLSPHGPVGLRPLFPQFVLREQNQEAIKCADRVLELLQADGRHVDYEEWLFDADRPGFIGPRRDSDFRYFPGAREAIDCYDGTKPYRLEMERLKEDLDSWYREEATGELRPNGNQGNPQNSQHWKNRNGGRGGGNVQQRNSRKGETGGVNQAQGRNEPQDQPGPSGINRK